MGQDRAGGAAQGEAYSPLTSNCLCCKQGVSKTGAQLTEPSPGDAGRLQLLAGRQGWSDCVRCLSAILPALSPPVFSPPCKLSYHPTCPSSCTLPAPHRPPPSPPPSPFLSHFPSLPSFHLEHFTEHAPGSRLMCRVSFQRPTGEKPTQCEQASDSPLLTSGPPRVLSLAWHRFGWSDPPPLHQGLSPSLTLALADCRWV